MARFLALGVPATHSAIAESDTLPTIVTKIFDHTIASLDHTRRSFDLDPVERAVELIEASKRIHFFGYGASSIIAEDAQQKSPLFGRPCTASADPNQQFIDVATSDEHSLFFLISYTGHTLPLPLLAEDARANGSRVIAITGTANSPLAKSADIVLVTETLEDTDLLYTDDQPHRGAHGDRHPRHGHRDAIGSGRPRAIAGHEAEAGQVPGHARPESPDLASVSPARSPCRDQNSLLGS